MAKPVQIVKYHLQRLYLPWVSHFRLPLKYQSREWTKTISSILVHVAYMWLVWTNSMERRKTRGEVNRKECSTDQLAVQGDKPVEISHWVDKNSLKQLSAIFFWFLDGGINSPRTQAHIHGNKIVYSSQTIRTVKVACFKESARLNQSFWQRFRYEMNSIYLSRIVN